MFITNVDGRTFIKFLESKGFAKVRQKGSHSIFGKDGKIVVVPAYKKKVIKPGLLKGSLEKVSIDPQEFIDFVSN